MRISITDIQQKKNRSEKIAVVTAYDYSTAKICDTSGIEIILVGDSAGMVMLGYNSTISVTVDEMLVFCKGVINGSKKCSYCSRYAIWFLSVGFIFSFPKCY